MCCFPDSAFHSARSLRWTPPCENATETVEETATDCNQLHKAATDCNRLQQTAPGCYQLQPTATDCNQLQDCNRVQDCNRLQPTSAGCKPNSCLWAAANRWSNGRARKRVWRISVEMLRVPNPTCIA